MDKNIAVVICNYNGGEYVLRCVESFMNSDRDDFDICVVDNASTDASVAQLREFYPHVKILQNGNNLGGAGGFDAGFQYAIRNGYGFVMAMDNDAYVAKNTLSLLYDYMVSHPKTGMAAAKIMCLEEPTKILDYDGKLDFRNITVSMNWWMKDDSPATEVTKTVEFAPTTASLIRADALKLSGGMDAQYFIYLDDIEMSRRILKCGFEVVVLGEAKAWHKSGLSQAGNLTTFKQYYFNRNRYYFFSRFADDSIIDAIAENILRESWQIMTDAYKEGYPSVFNTQKYALLDFIADIRGKALPGRIAKIQYCPDEMRIRDKMEYGFFRNLFYDLVMERINILRYKMNESNIAKVAVIVPVYNTAKYLPMCLDSITGQSLRELEIICVDDGSTDESGSILDDYASKDQRITIIHKKNEGYGKAVNTGLDLVHATYVGIVESDDYIEHNMYAVLYKIMLQSNADVIKADYYGVYERNGRMIKRYMSLSQFGADKKLYCRSLNPQKHPDVLLFGKYTWSGLYRTKFLNQQGIRHNETPGAAYQNNGFWFQTMIKAHKVYFLNEAFYNYRLDNSSTSFFNKGNPLAEIEEYRFTEKKMLEMGENGKKFYGWLSSFLLSNGYYSFHRVEKQYKLQVALRLREEFNRLAEKEYIDVDLISQNIRSELLYILSNPKVAAKRDASIVERFLGKLSKHTNYIIYGAGIKANQLLQRMKGERLEQRIVCFAVSNICGNPSNIEDIPVKEFTLDMIDENTLVIIAIKNAEGLKDRLHAMGVKYIVHSQELI